MGFDTDDMRIRDSFQVAEEKGIAFCFVPNEEETDVHPNTVDIHMVNAAGQEMTVRGESLGGGKARISRINGVDVDFTGEYSAVIVIQKDRPGVVAHITKVLSDRGVNIAFMRLFRKAKGEIAYTIVESDGRLPEDVAQKLEDNENVQMILTDADGNKLEKFGGTTTDPENGMYEIQLQFEQTDTNQIHVQVIDMDQSTNDNLAMVAEMTVDLN